MTPALRRAMPLCFAAAAVAATVPLWPLLLAADAVPPSIDSLLSLRCSGAAGLRGAAFRPMAVASATGAATNVRRDAAATASAR